MRLSRLKRVLSDTNIVAYSIVLYPNKDRKNESVRWSGYDFKARGDIWSTLDKEEADEMFDRAFNSLKPSDYMGRWEIELMKDIINEDGDVIQSDVEELAVAPEEEDNEDKEEAVLRKVLSEIEDEADEEPETDKEDNPVDIITLDVPLFTRLLEYSREDAKDDVALHLLLENCISAMQDKDTLTMDDYGKLLNESDDDEESEKVESSMDFYVIGIKADEGKVAFVEKVADEFVVKQYEDGLQSSHPYLASSYEEASEIAEHFTNAYLIDLDVFNAEYRLATGKNYYVTEEEKDKE
jgi:hypothetical protein